MTPHMVYDLKKLQKYEQMRLMPYAVLSEKSKGRIHEEKHADNRLCFQKDRDRIIHSKAFRRLEAKTQVFVADFGDHFRNRLTHTLEVAQISRDICRTLGLNEDLAECIALAHDLGHTPFGHIGEEVLDEMMKNYNQEFEHNLQSKRVVEILEKVYPSFDGLNLSIEVLDGLIKHKTSWDNKDKYFEVSPHLEAQVVNLADEIAYTNHDVDDGLRSGLITFEELEGIELWEITKAVVKEKYKDAMDDEVFTHRCVSNMISYMIEDLYEESSRRLEENNIQTLEDVRKFKGELISFTPGTFEKLKELRDLLTNEFYFSKKVIGMHSKGKTIIQELFDFYYEFPRKLPENRYNQITNGEKKEIVIKDYIAGMTDHFAKNEWENFTQK